MNLFVIIFLAGFEIIGLVAIIRLWRRPTMGLLPRILWTAVLLIPLFGLLVKGLMINDLEKNPERLTSTADDDAFCGGGGGHGY